MIDFILWARPSVILLCMSDFYLPYIDCIPKSTDEYRVTFLANSMMLEFASSFYIIQNVTRSVRRGFRTVFWTEGELETFHDTNGAQTSHRLEQCFIMTSPSIRKSGYLSGLAFNLSRKSSYHFSPRR